MKLPVRAWTETLTSLGFTRKKTSARPKGPSSRRTHLESLEPRQMLTATTLSWDPTASAGAHLGGTGTWNTSSAQWYNSTTHADQVWNNANGDTALFAGTAGTVTVSSGITAGEVDFTSANYTLSSGSLSVLGTGKIDVAAGIGDTISSTLNGTHGLTKTGSGDLNLTAANTFTGSTAINSGRLALKTNSTASLSSGSVTVAAGAELYTASAVNLSNSFFISGDGGTGSSVDGELRGAIRMDAGTISGSATVSLQADASIGAYGSGMGTINAVISGAHALSLNKSNANAPGTIVFGGANTYSATTVTNGRLKLQGVVLGSSSVVINAGATLEYSNASGSVTQTSATLSGAGTLQKTGAGTVVFGGTGTVNWNFGSGAVIDVQAGTLVGGNNQKDVWTSDMASLNIAAGATFSGVEANVRVDALTGAGTFSGGYAGAVIRPTPSA